MRLPIIKHLVQFIDDNDSDYIEETISVLEHLTENPNIKDEEIDVIGELLSNLYGAAISTICELKSLIFVVNAVVIVALFAGAICSKKTVILEL
jgi:hypothetical protein